MDLIDQPIFLEGISAKHFVKAKLVGYSSHPVLLINRGAAVSGLGGCYNYGDQLQIII